MSKINKMEADRSTDIHWYTYIYENSQRVVTWRNEGKNKIK